MNLKLSKSVFVTLFLFVNSNIFASPFDLGSWNILNFKFTQSDRWSFFAETQLRSLKFYDNFHYYEYKGGFNFGLHKDLKLSLGCGSYQTFKEGGNFQLPKNNNEFRIWPQVILSQSFGKIKIEQRYRTELRFTSNGYRNRFRYRFGITLPVGEVKNGFNKLTFSASNEIFFTDNEPYFERNRAILAVNLKPIKSLTLQLGFIHQFDYKITDETGRDFFQIGVFYEIFRKNGKIESSEMDLKDN